MNSERPAMELRNVWRRFGSTEVLRDVSIRVDAASFTALLGPSGCGKSTTLRILAGLDQPDQGDVLLHGNDVAERSAAQRNVAMVFQSYALYPHFTVYQNIALPLAMRDMNRLQRAPVLSRLMPSAQSKRTEQRARIVAVAETLGIADLLARKPSQLSGGQKQRVALARALVRDPSIFLLDEPLSNLDARLRVQMRGELSELHRLTGKPFVYVTHDQAEAMAMSDQVVVMMSGKVMQAGKPKELYERPAALDVARFIGAYPVNEFTRDLGPGAPVPGGCVLAVRPEDLLPRADGPVSAHLRRAEYMGNETLLHLTLADGREVRSVVPMAFAVPPIGDSVRLGFAAERGHLFEIETGLRQAERNVAAA